MKLVTSFDQVRQEARGRVGLVPTMGYLHEGHLSLVAAAAEAADTVVVSVFVNPLQFGEEDDLNRYPRDRERDAALASEAGADLVFAPELDAMYPRPPQTLVTVGGVADPLEGERRPGHFRGVATVVTKLLAGIRPQLAFFGRKDAQQLAVIERLVLDLSFPVEIVGMPTVREADGLALSSRNVFLSPAERGAALGISGGLFAAADRAEAGVRSAAELEETARAVMTAVDVEYVEVVDAVEFTRLATVDRQAVLAAAARVGKTRLIDNIGLFPAATGLGSDRGIRLDRPSRLYGAG